MLGQIESGFRLWRAGNGSQNSMKLAQASLLPVGESPRGLFFSPVPSSVGHALNPVRADNRGTPLYKHEQMHTRAVRHSRTEIMEVPSKPDQAWRLDLLPHGCRTVITFVERELHHRRTEREIIPCRSVNKHGPKGAGRQSQSVPRTARGKLSSRRLSDAMGWSGQVARQHAPGRVPPRRRDVPFFNARYSACFTR